MKNSYSDDRISLAQEIAEVLSTRGYWVPKKKAGSDLIVAVAQALQDAFYKGKIEGLIEARRIVEINIQYVRAAMFVNGGNMVKAKPGVKAALDRFEFHWEVDQSKKEEELKNDKSNGIGRKI